MVVVLEWFVIDLLNLFEDDNDYLSYSDILHHFSSMIQFDMLDKYMSVCLNRKMFAVLVDHVYLQK